MMTVYSLSIYKPQGSLLQFKISSHISIVPSIVLIQRVVY